MATLINSVNVGAQILSLNSNGGAVWIGSNAGFTPYSDTMSLDVANSGTIYIGNNNTNNIRIGNGGGAGTIIIESSQAVTVDSGLMTNIGLSGNVTIGATGSTGVIEMQSDQIDLGYQDFDININIGATGPTATNTVTIGNNVTTNVIFNPGAGTVTFNSGLITKPVASSTATSGFGTSLTAGTAKHNTLGYDILVNISVAVTSATTATLVLGVGSTSTPTTNTVIPSFTVAAFTPFNFSAIVPNDYYLLVNSTGTITISSITTQVCPL